MGKKATKEQIHKKLKVIDWTFLMRAVKSRWRTRAKEACRGTGPETQYIIA